MPNRRVAAWGGTEAMPWCAWWREPCRARLRAAWAVSPFQGDARRCRDRAMETPSDPHLAASADAGGPSHRPSRGRPGGRRRQGVPAGDREPATRSEVTVLDPGSSIEPGFQARAGCSGRNRIRRTSPVPTRPAEGVALTRDMTAHNIRAPNMRIRLISLQSCTFRVLSSWMGLSWWQRASKPGLPT